MIIESCVKQEAPAGRPGGIWNTPEGINFLKTDEMRVLIRNGLRQGFRPFREVISGDRLQGADDGVVKFLRSTGSYDVSKVGYFPGRLK